MLWSDFYKYLFDHLSIISFGSTYDLHKKPSLKPINEFKVVFCSIYNDSFTTKVCIEDIGQIALGRLDKLFDVLNPS